MKSLLRFVRTTLVGGILFLVPVIVVIMILGKALAVAHKIVAPLAAHIPIKSAIGLETPKLLAITLLVLFCFLAGFLARTVIAQKIINWLETTILSNVPGYEFIKSSSSSLLAAENQPAYPVVLAPIGNVWQIGVLIERLADGHVAVFVPGAPNLQSGSLYFMAEEQIRLVDLPITSVVKCLKRYGLGSNALLGNRLSAASQRVAVNKPG